MNEHGDLIVNSKQAGAEQHPIPEELFTLSASAKFRVEMTGPLAQTLDHDEANPAGDLASADMVGGGIDQGTDALLRGEMALQLQEILARSGAIPVGPEWTTNHDFPQGSWPQIMSDFHSDESFRKLSESKILQAANEQEKGETCFETRMSDGQAAPSNLPSIPEGPLDQHTAETANEKGGHSRRSRTRPRGEKSPKADFPTLEWHHCGVDEISAQRQPMDEKEASKLDALVALTPSVHRS
ncbi:MAG: hypothetical protein SGARI_006678, partial [Bacillariaceae sp.]